MKKKKMFFLLSVFLSQFTGSIFAYDFEVDGIYYDIYSSTEKTVKVTYKSYYQGGSYSEGYDLYYNSGYSGDVVIPSEVSYLGTDYTVVQIGNDAFCDDNVESAIYSVTLPNTIKSIGSEAFCRCGSLKNIIIPASVTYIGNNAFFGCKSLETVIIPEGVSCSFSAFDFCSGLVSATVNCAELPSFGYCDNLNMISLGKSVNKISGYSCSTCPNLTSITIDSNNATYSSYNGVVYDKSKSTLIKCPAGKSEVTIYSGTKTIGSSAFSGCANLTSVTLPSNVTEVQADAFRNCKKLQKAEFPQKATVLGNLIFYGCSALEEFKIPYYATELPYGFFYNCSSLKNVISTELLTSIGTSAFRGCKNLQSFTISNKLTSIGSEAFRDCSSLMTLKYQNNTNSILATIGEYAFYNCSALEYLYIPKTVTAIGGYAFSGCSSLKNIQVNWNGTNSSTYQVIPIASNVFSETTYQNANLLSITKSAVPVLSSTASWNRFSSIVEFYPARSVVIDPIDGPVVVDRPQQLNAIAYYNKYTNSFTLATIQELNWTSSNPEVATVSSDGVVTGLRNGVVTITATTIDGTEISSSVTLDVKYASNIMFEDIKIRQGKTEILLPLYLDNEVSICNMQFDLYLPNGIAIPYDEEEEMYVIEKGPRAKTRHNIDCSLLADGAYRILCTSTTNIAFEDTDKSLPLMFIPVTVPEELPFGDYILTMKSIKLNHYDADTKETTSYIVPEMTSVLNVIQCVHVIANSSNSEMGSVSITSPTYTSEDGLVDLDDMVKFTATPAFECRFSNWRYTSSGSYITSSNPYSRKATSDINIEALFVVDDYTVTFKVDGTVYSSGKQIKGRKVVVPEVDPVKAGYIFLGWKGVTEETTVPGYSVTYNAEFVIDEVTVTFTVDGEEYSSGIQHNGQLLTLPVANPIKTGYTFTGWKDVTAETIVPDHDVVYPAVFEINQYNVKFIAKETIVCDAKQDYNSSISIPDAPEIVGYKFISWGDVPATVPDHDVVFTADYLLLGDVYEDDILDVTDITAIAGAILDNAATLTDRQFMAADLCEDDVIDVTDYTIGVGLVLDATGDVNARPAMAPSVSQDKAKLILNNCVLDGNEGVLYISMDNSGDQIANIQFDIDLPMGINIDDLSLTSRSRNGHGIDYLEQKDGSVRVLIYSNNNTAIRDSEGVILELVLSNDLPLVGDYDIAMKNIVLARENRTGIHQDECHALLSCDNVSGLSTVADNGLKIVVGRGYVQISSDSEQTVFVHNVAGICVGQTLTNSIPTKIELPAGIYMINGKRISIK